MLSVDFGAAVGSLTRYLITFIWKQFKIDWPIATLIINVLGSFLLGWLTSNYLANSFLATGMMGGFTTFSTFNVELISMINERRWKSFLLYFMCSYCLGIAAAICGMMIHL